MLECFTTSLSPGESDVQMLSVPLQGAGLYLLSRGYGQGVVGVNPNVYYGPKPEPGTVGIRVGFMANDGSRKITKVKFCLLERDGRAGVGFYVSSHFYLTEH